MNTIPQVQDEPRQLDRLAAQRQLYADAKRILAAQMLFSAFISVALALWSAHDTRHPQVRVWAAAWGVGFTLADVFWLTPWQKVLKKTASTIQEMFDCDVLQLPFKRGREPVEVESVARAAERYKRRSSMESLKNWYPVEVGALPLELARVLCQRANCWWDAGLRRRYMTGVYCVVVPLAVGVMVYGLMQDLKMTEWLKGVVLPLAPLLVLGARQIWENREAAETVSRLKRDADKLWSEAVKGQSSSETLIGKSRDLQDDIWEQRGKNPLIFDWIYRRLQRDDEKHMNVGAAELIEQTQQAGKESQP
jgi:hypothetical protein